jgi:hypothetical protein
MARVCQQDGSRALKTEVAAGVSRQRLPSPCEQEPVGFEPGAMLDGG